MCVVGPTEYDEHISFSDQAIMCMAENTTHHEFPCSTNNEGDTRVTNSRAQHSIDDAIFTDLECGVSSSTNSGMPEEKTEFHSKFKMSQDKVRSFYESAGVQTTLAFLICLNFGCDIVEIQLRPRAVPRDERRVLQS